MKLIDTIFCDDIRYENHNKISLMGIYGDKIQFIQNNPNEELKWPLPIKISLLLRFQKNSTTQQPDNFEFDYLLNGNPMGTTVKGTFSTDNDQSLLNITINANGLPIELGALGFRVKVYKGTQLLHTEEVISAIKVTKQ